MYERATNTWKLTALFHIVFVSFLRNPHKIAPLTRKKKTGRKIKKKIFFINYLSI